jgi:uncharacterized protein (TIGR03790 family)
MSMTKRISSLIAIICAGGFAFGADNPGDEVVIVYNTRVPESREVADYYAKRRHVPTNQIFGFALSTDEEFSRNEFQEKLQKPLAKALEAQKLWHMSSHTGPATNNQPARAEWRVTTSKIRYAVLCYGVPIRIAEDPNYKEPGMETLRPEMRRNVAAVDSELALLPLIEQKLPLAGPLRNPLFASTNETAFHPTNGVLLVSRLDGPTALIARGLVDKAIEAETNGLWGRAYFDVRNTTEAGMKAGDDWIHGAAEIYRRLGFETVVDENAGTFPESFPMSQIAIYMGWYSENVSGPFTRPVVEFMPGAFAYHLHSFSAWTIRSTTSHWVGPLLAKGATITMGCVDEPYLGGTPDVAVFAARFTFQGFTFGEAACASQAVLSWQTTVIGDPLYRPFGKNPDQLQEDLLRRQSPWIEWSYLRLADLNQANGKPVSEIVTLLEELELTKKSAVLSEKLGDLCLGQGKPSSAVHAYLQALQSAPSQQQRVRITLAVGEQLAALDRNQEAYQAYQQLLDTFPDYVDKLGLCKKLLSLAQKLNKKSDADRFEAEIKHLSLANR